MKNTIIRTIGLLAIMLAAHVSYAHDPAEHMKKNEKPKCAAMDHSKMDMNDPVAEAMRKQCSKDDQSIKKESSHDMHTDMQDKKAMNNQNHDEHQH